MLVVSLSRSLTGSAGDQPVMLGCCVSKRELFQIEAMVQYKIEMYCKLSLRDVRAVMRTPGPSISLLSHTS